MHSTATATEECTAQQIRTTFTNTLFSVNDSTGIIDMVQHPTQPSTVYATSFTRIRTERESVVYGTEVYVYKSTDFGQTWTMLTGGLPNGKRRTSDSGSPFASQVRIRCMLCILQVMAIRIRNYTKPPTEERVGIR